MKQFLANAVTSLVTGIFFSLGLLLVFFAVTEFLPDGPSKPDLKYTHFPSDLRVIRFAKVEGVPSLTIRGTVENVGTTTWQQVSVEAPIKVGGTMMNRCETDIPGDFPPRSTKAFQIKCFDVAGSNLPGDTSYDVVVTSAGSEG